MQDNALLEYLQKMLWTDIYKSNECCTMYNALKSMKTSLHNKQSRNGQCDTGYVACLCLEDITRTSSFGGTHVPAQSAISMFLIGQRGNMLQILLVFSILHLHNRLYVNIFIYPEHHIRAMS